MRRSNDARLKSALGRLKTHFAHRRQEAAERYGDFEGLREAGRAIRDHAHRQSRHAARNLRAQRRSRAAARCIGRATRQRRATIILGILREAGAKTVTKGKSMVSEEIALNPFLEANGMMPVETDLGEYIIQLRKEPPSHIIAPAFHLHKEQVETTFRAAHTTLDPNRALDERQALVAEARTMLRTAFESADAGITGANFLSAAEGAAVIVTNEGNGDLTRLLPQHPYRADRHREGRAPISTMSRCCCAC